MSNHHKFDFSNTEVAFQSQNDKQLRLNYYIFRAMNLNWLVNIGTFFIKLFLKLGLPIKFIVKPTIFQLFCGGEDINDCENTIEKLYKHKIGTILDYSVEGEDNEKSFDKTRDEIIKTIYKAKSSPDKIPFSVFKVTGIGSRPLLTEVQAKGVENLSQEKQEAYQRVTARIRQLCETAANNDVRLFIDAEETYIQDVIDATVLKEMKKYNKAGSKTLIYNTYQLYRTEAYGILEKHLNEAKVEGFTVGAKFVRGAYMEKERDRAAQMGYADPINPDKKSTDVEFNKAVSLSLNHLDYISVCLGSHNEESCLLAVDIMEKNGTPKDDERVYFAQLLGMSDNISFNLSANGYNVVKYVPYGPVEKVMPYLIRRAEENTSISGQSSREYLLIKKEKERRKNL